MKTRLPVIWRIGLPFGVTIALLILFWSALWLEPAHASIPTALTTTDLTVCNTVTDVPLDECQALVTLFTSTNGTGWITKTGWLQSATACSWYKVICTNGRVTHLQLFRNNLSGSIPPEIENLRELKQLLLSGNQLTGSIPGTIVNLTKLQFIDLGGNQLSGPIPRFENLVNLSKLSLAVNKLTGPVPPEIGTLTNLTSLSFGSNQLTGTIPSQLGDLTRLTFLSLFANQLSGPIPNLEKLTQLETLSLGANRLSGPIPEFISKLTKLKMLGLNQNQLTGPIPPQLNQLTNLTELILADNQLTGPIPPQLGDLATLTKLNLAFNQLSGALPAELVKLSKLTTFYFDATQLCEPKAIDVQNWLARITNLRRAGVCLTAFKVEKSVTPQTATPGVTASVRITISADAATSVVLTEMLPASLTYAPESATGGLQYQPATNRFIYQAPIMPNTPYVFTYQVVIALDSPPGSVFNFITQLSGTEAQPVEKSVTAVIPNQEINTLVLVYAVADNDLGDEAIQLLNHLEQATSLNPSLTTAMMIDIPGADNALLYYVKPDPISLNCPNYRDPFCNGRYTLGDNVFRWPDDTASVASLHSFVVESIKAHPNTQRVILSLVGHGSGWGYDVLPSLPRILPDQPGGLLLDQQPQGSLSTAGLRKALETVEAETGKRIALLYLDACSMAMAEVAYEVAGTADYLLASESLSWATFPYAEFLAAINDGMSNVEIGQRWIEIAGETLQKHGGSYPYTLSLINLQKMGVLAQASNQLSQALRALLTNPTTKNELAAAIQVTQCFDNNYDGAIDLADTYCDLYHFTLQLNEKFSTHPDIKQAVQAVQSALRESVIVKRYQAGTPWPFQNATFWQFSDAELGGLSVYMPLSPRRDELQRRFYRSEYLKWVGETGWGNFIGEYWGGQEPSVSDGSNDSRVPVKLFPLQPTVKIRADHREVQPNAKLMTFLEFSNLPSNRGVSSAKVRIEYQKSVLTITNCTVKGDGGDCNYSEPGVIQLNYVSIGGVFSDTVAATIEFHAVGGQNTTSELQVSVIDFFDGENNPLTPIAIDDVVSIGSFPIAQAGDVNCSRGINVVDVRMILRYTVGLLGTTTNCPTTDNTILLPACDVDRTGVCDVIDGLYVSQYTIGIPNVIWPSGSGATQSAYSQTGRGSLLSKAPLDLQVLDSGTDDKVTIAVVANTESVKLGAMTASVQYDPTKLQLISCESKQVNASTICNLAYDIDQQGLDKAQISFISNQGVAGESQLAQLHFQVLRPLSTNVRDDVGVEMITLSDVAGNSILLPSDKAQIFLPVILR